MIKFTLLEYPTLQDAKPMTFEEVKRPSRLMQTTKPSQPNG